MARHRSTIITILALASLLGLAGCSTAPSHPTLAAGQAQGTLAPLVPMRRYVADVDAEGGYQLSPDGRRLLWHRVVGLDGGLAVRGVDEPPEAARRFAIGFLTRADTPGGNVNWLPDSRHFAYVKDFSGDEATQIFIQDAEAPAAAPWAVTPWPGVRSTLLGRGAAGTSSYYFVSNRRDRKTFDLYQADAATRSVRELARSDGSVVGWLIDAQRQLAGRIRKTGPSDDSDTAFEWRQPDGGWRPWRSVGPWDSLRVVGIDLAAGKAWVLHNLQRDKSALFEVDIASGQERLLAEDAQVDLQYAQTLPGQARPVAVVSEPAHPRVQWLDQALGQAVQAATQQALAQGLLRAPPRVARLQNAAQDQQTLIVRAVGDFDVAELLVERGAQRVTRLDPFVADAQALLARDEPMVFTASDGRAVHGYLTRPQGVKGRVPLVVNIHGGPWARDQWNPDSFSFSQMLANRGYAVLRLNYRGSAGYGRAHMDAAALQTWGRVQQDIAEGAQWAIDQGIADPARMAVLGGSFGGFSVLAQLIQQRHDWRCGVDLVGVADWPRLMDHWPPFWRNRHMFVRFYGDPADPAQRARMRDESPVAHLDRIRAPLLVIHGANDIRVLKGDSDDVVAALRARGHPVEYLVFPDEGHSTRKWRNRLEQSRRVEDFLSQCLGGRSAGWDFYQLMPGSGQTR